MYSSKPLTKWSGATFLSSKEPYSSPNKKRLNSRYTGCQFKANPSKKGREGLFTRWKYESNGEFEKPKKRVQK